MAVKHISFWEVSTFKHLTFFHPRYMKDADGHQRVREFLASTLLTGGKSLDIETPYKSLGSGSTCPNYSPHGPRHKFKTFTGHSKHKCAYCGAGCYTYCATCSGEDPPRHAFCSFVTGRDCQDNHRRGVQPKFTMRIHKSRRRLLRRALPPGIRRAPRAPRPSASAQALCQRLRQLVHRLAPTSARRARVGRGPCIRSCKI